MKFRFIRLALSTLAVGSALGVAAPTAFADETGTKALAAVDASINQAKTQVIEYSVTISQPDKADRNLGLKIWIKGDKRLSEFTSPADVKGTKVLILSPTEMYVYLPSYGKVRRIASHATDQGFMGMNFSQDDFSLLSYSGSYTANQTSDDGTNLKLTLVPKGDTAPYPRIDMGVEKARSLPLTIDYFNDTGTDLKTETRSSYTCEGTICTPSEIKMVDHTKGDMSTTLARKSLKINSDLSDDLFTKRALEQ